MLDTQNRFLTETLETLFECISARTKHERAIYKNDLK